MSYIQYLAQFYGSQEKIKTQIDSDNKFNIITLAYRIKRDHTT